MKSAYKFDPSNSLILNDLCNLEVYFENYNEYLKNAGLLFKKTPNTYTLTRYAFAMVLCEHYEAANKVFDSLQSSWTPSNSEDELIFRSELSLYRALVFIRNGEYQRCLNFLHENNFIRDHVLSLEDQVICYEKLGNIAETKRCILELLKDYPENGDYFDVLEKITPKDQLIDELTQIQNSLKSKYAQVRILEILDVNDTRFKDLLSAYLKPLFIKGVPSIYLTIKEFSKEKLNVALELSRSFELPISSIPMVHLFAGQVYGYSGDLEKAIEELDNGLKHTPTCIELIQWKARFYLKYGNIEKAIGAAKALSSADPADRNVNLLYVKTLFQGCFRDKAFQKASIFAGEEAGKPLIYETQFNKYYLQSGMAALRTNDIEFAKKMYNGILTHFENYRKDEYNYIGWSWRKPRALFEMIEEIRNIEKNDILAIALEMLILLGIKEKDENLKDLALRTLKCTPRAIAMGCIVFLQKKMIIQAIRCYHKLLGTPYIYMVLPLMTKALTDISSYPEVVQEIIKEE